MAEVQNARVQKRITDESYKLFDFARTESGGTLYTRIDPRLDHRFDRTDEQIHRQAVGYRIVSPCRTKHVKVMLDCRFQNGKRTVVEEGWCNG